MSSDVRSTSGVLPVSTEPVEVSVSAISETPVEHHAARGTPVLLPGGPLRIEVPALHAPARVAAVVPCFNRPDDARLLLDDLSKLDLRGIDLRVLIVDNASDQPLDRLGLALDHSPPPSGPPRCSITRLERNTGGSGGFNIGIDLVLGREHERDPAPSPWADFNADWLWLIDSDARVLPGTLRSLLDAMLADERVVACGPAICDPSTGIPFELGGRMNLRSGLMEPVVPGAAGVIGPVECEYLAACCALVRADAARCAGPMPDTFLNADDAEWFIRMRRRTGGRVLALPGVRAMHPRFDRFPTWTRYYTTRNALGPLNAIAAPRTTRFARAGRDVLRAAQQQFMERPDLARLHMLGLRRAGQRGPAPTGAIGCRPAAPLRDLLPALRRELGELRGKRVGITPDCGLDAPDRHAFELALHAAGASTVDLPARSSPLRTLRRWILGPDVDVAIVPARGRHSSWWRGRVQIQVADGQFFLARPRRLRSVLAAAGTLALGALHTQRAAGRVAVDDEPSMLDIEYRSAHAHAGDALSVEVIILSHNRWPALQHTVERIRESRWFTHSAAARRRITVVDNASSDGTADRAEVLLTPLGVRVLRLPENVGVDAFNHAALHSDADVLIILDDDATPDDHAVRIALDDLARAPGLAAVTLLPSHPRTGAVEWPFARQLRGGSSDRWPVMGCANIIRRSAWMLVGGYEPAMFLYRNDTDLALKLLGAGLGVRFDPALVAWHDTPASPGKPKSLRWHELATRNWIWLARRHGRGVHLPIGAILGWAWAHALARASLPRHLATLKGAWLGMTMPAPPTPQHCNDSGAAWRDLLALRFSGRPPRADAGYRHSPSPPQRPHGRHDHPSAPR